MRRTFLAIDDVSLPLRKNICLYISRPTVRPEPVLVPSPKESNAPDNLAAHFYGTVLHDAGKFRMWYYACHIGRNPDWPPRKQQQLARNPGWLIGEKEGYEVHEGPPCYAESDDGITWTKPALGQVLFKGSRANNALDLPHAIISGVSVIRDDADPEPGRCYKMVYQYFPDQSDPPIPEYGSKPSIACAVSPDGIRWMVSSMPFVNQFVEHCSFMKHDGMYIVHSHDFPGTAFGGGTFAEGGSAGGRTGIAHSTYDFDHWPDLWQWTFALPEPANPAVRGMDYCYDQVHMGAGAASFGNVCVGVYGVWHNHPFGEDFVNISCDLGLLVSNDGLRFRELAVTPGQPFISHEESPATQVPDRAFKTILCQGNGILNVGDETRIYHGRWRNSGTRGEDISAYYWSEVALATIPRDRWGALKLSPGASEGTICSAPITFPAGTCELRINASGAEGLSVDLLDEKFQLIPGFADGRVTGSGGLDCKISWTGKNQESLAGRTLRVQVRLRRSATADPQVFALYL